jgi:hypothetical protein
MAVPHDGCAYLGIGRRAAHFNWRKGVAFILDVASMVCGQPSRLQHGRLMPTFNVHTGGSALFGQG